MVGMNQYAPGVVKLTKAPSNDTCQNSIKAIEKAGTIFEDNMVSCKPLLKWPGGKMSEMREIVPRIPRHTRYFEPFFGGGSVFFNSISVPSFGNDRHSDLVLFYKYVKVKDERFYSLVFDFLSTWEKYPSRRKELYLDARKRYNQTKEMTERRAVDFFFIRELAYGGMFRVNQAGKFNVPFGNGYINKNIQGKIDTLNSVSVQRKMKLLEISNFDFEDFMQGFNFSRNDFMFVDPPYDSTFTQYGDHNFDKEDQKRLADILLQFKGKFMLVCQYTPLMDRLYKYKNIRFVFYDKQYRFNIKGRFNRSVQHSLITNYASDI